MFTLFVKFCVCDNSSSNFQDNAINGYCGESDLSANYVLLSESEV